MISEELPNHSPFPRCPSLNAAFAAFISSVTLRTAMAEEFRRSGDAAKRFRNAFGTMGNQAAPKVGHRDGWKIWEKNVKTQSVFLIHILQ